MPVSEYTQEEWEAAALVIATEFVKYIDAHPRDEAGSSGAFQAQYALSTTCDLTRCRELLKELAHSGRSFYAMVGGESPSLLEDDHNAFKFHEALQKD